MRLPLLHFVGLGSPIIQFCDLKVPEKSSNNYQYGKNEVDSCPKPFVV